MDKRQPAAVAKTVEILALKWRDLNLKTGELHISRQVLKVNGKVLISTPKTKSSNRMIQKFLEEHEADIIIHKAAKKAFDEMGVKKLPTVKSLQVEFADLLTVKKEAYAELRKVRDELRELTVHKANYEELRNLEEREKRKEKEHGRE